MVRLAVSNIAGVIPIFGEHWSLSTRVPASLSHEYLMELNLSDSENKNVEKGILGDYGRILFRELRPYEGKARVKRFRVKKDSMCDSAYNFRIMVIRICHKFSLRKVTLKEP